MLHCIFLMTRVRDNNQLNRKSTRSVGLLKIILVRDETTYETLQMSVFDLDRLPLSPTSG